MANYSAPGVYIEEKNAFPNSVVAVDTAIPAFIGYTYKAAREGKSLVGVPTAVNSFAEYVAYFGGAFSPKFLVKESVDLSNKNTFQLGAKQWTLQFAENNEAYFFNSIRLFYANGGGTCVILSVGTYGDTGMVAVKQSDFCSTTKHPLAPLQLLKQEQYVTLIVLPDVVVLGTGAYLLYKEVLAHCAEMQSCFGIFDLKKHDLVNKQTTLTLLEEFRENIGSQFLSYGAAYYPWLNTQVVGTEEITFGNFDSIEKLLEQEAPIQEILANYTHSCQKIRDAVGDEAKENACQALADLKFLTHQALKKASKYYGLLVSEGLRLANQLPASAALAGLYTTIDNNRGVWKSPANCSLNSVSSALVPISHDEQEKFNIDPLGKSVNVIRSFQGAGILVWGARTLDGNSNDFRYISVRRTLIMLEQSVKLALRAYVFEPNNSSTWIAVRATVENFLINLWKQGALAGAAPEDAFNVKIGLGSTMTPTDILEGKLLLTLLVAIVKPAEFILLTFQQQLQQS